MRITAESTEKIVAFNGVPARIWEAVTENGIRCHLYVTRIAVSEGEDCSEFDQELQEHKPPSVEIQAIPLRMIL